MWRRGLWLAVAVPSLAQLAYPQLLEVAARDPGAIQRGQWWRLATSMFVQDGGLPGTIFNLILLAVVLKVARIPDRMVIPVFMVGGVLSNLLVLAIWPSEGAGNSMATLFLLAAAKPNLKLAVALAAIALLLLGLRDVHGLALAAGLLAGILRIRGGEAT